jgi:hypothetical protein
MSVVGRKSLRKCERLVPLTPTAPFSVARRAWVGAALGGTPCAVCCCIREEGGGEDGSEELSGCAEPLGAGCAVRAGELLPEEVGAALRPLNGFRMGMGIEGIIEKIEREDLSFDAEAAGAAAPGAAAGAAAAAAEEAAEVEAEEAGAAADCAEAEAAAAADAALARAAVSAEAVAGAALLEVALAAAVAGATEEGATLPPAAVAVEERGPGVDVGAGAAALSGGDTGKVGGGETGKFEGLGVAVLGTSSGAEVAVAVAVFGVGNLVLIVGGGFERRKK